MGEIRTTSATGGQKGVKPERLTLLPRLGLEAIARVFGFGESKYAAHNWRKGYEWSKSLDALQRHVLAFQDGETLDPESGESHLAHAGFHVLVLLTWLAEQGEGGTYDDRYRPEPEVEPTAVLDEAFEFRRPEALADLVDRIVLGPRRGPAPLTATEVAEEIGVGLRQFKRREPRHRAPITNVGPDLRRHQAPYVVNGEGVMTRKASRTVGGHGS